MYLSGAELRGRQPEVLSSRTSGSPTETASSSESLGPIRQTASATAPSTTSASVTATAIASSSTSSSSPPTAIPIVVGVIAGVLGILLLFFVIRNTRIKHKNPKYVPTAFLKNSWKKWEPKSSSGTPQRLPDTNDHLEPVSTTRSSQAAASFDTTGRTPNASSVTTPATTAAGVDRNTSVRSVMTLPAYNPNPHQNEQVLGREGERGGIDVVLEYPENEQDDERLREEEMEALYQVRLARRRENEEREERRRLRREARDRGDYVALRELQARARASSTASTGRSVEELRAEHERVKKERQRAVSSVAYGDLGVARHDGTRLRANSMESEREGLLGDAASIAASSHYHRRDRSASSIISLDTVNADFPSPGLTRSRANSRAESPFPQAGRPSQDESVHDGRAGSSPEMIEHEDFPPNSPPGYENIPLNAQTDGTHEPPPDYSSPIVGRGEHRPNFPTYDSSGSGQSRRISAHMGEPASVGRASNSSTGSPTSLSPSNEPSRSIREVGGTPQLPSLQISNLPSIQVDPGSPIVGRIQEEGHHP